MLELYLDSPHTSEAQKNHILIKNRVLAESSLGESVGVRESGSKVPCTVNPDASRR
jgi:hypothetical protein